MSWKGFFLGVLSFFLFFTAIASVIGVSSLTLLDADSYLPYLEKHGVYDFVEGSLNNTIGAGFLKLPNQSAQRFVEFVVVGVFDYINGRTETLSLTLELDTQELTEFFEREVEKVPVCAPGTKPEFTNNLSCRPANESVSEVTSRILSERNFTIQEGKVNLGEYLDKDGNLARVRDGVRTYRFVVYSFVAASLVLIGLILLIGWNTPSHGLRNIGIPLILVGIIVFVGFYFGSSQADQVISGMMPDLPVDSLNPGFLILDVLHGIYSKFFINSGILFVLGIVAVGSSFAFHNEKEQ